METVDRVLTGAGIALADLDGLCVSAGPGSFTGLRIGIATVKGIAMATGKPIAAVPTLMALAWNVPHAGYPVCPLLDARKNEVYAALFRQENNSLSTVMDTQTLSLDALAAKISQRTVFTGEGSYIFRADLQRRFGELALFAPLSALVPSAASVAELGMLALGSGKQIAPDDLVPIYIRRPEAEVAWEKRQRSR